jgi:GGDEF domain-containing protein
MSECRNRVSCTMPIDGDGTGDFMGSFTRPSSRPARSVSARSGTPEFNRWSAIREVTGWLGWGAGGRAHAGVVHVATDQKGWDLDQEAMFKTGHEMLCRSSVSHRPLSVVVFDLSDLPELECIFGVQAAEEIIVQTAAKLQRLATRKGLAVRTGATVFTVLLPGVGHHQAHDLIGAALGQPCCIELEAGGDEIILAPEFRVRTVFGHAVSLKETFEFLCRDMAQSRLQDERRSKYLARERESHSRPTRPQATKTGPRNIFQMAYPPLAATVLVPTAAC